MRKVFYSTCFLAHKVLDFLCESVFSLSTLRPLFDAATAFVRSDEPTKKEREKERKPERTKRNETNKQREIHFLQTIFQDKECMSCERRTTERVGHCQQNKKHKKRKIFRLPLSAVSPFPPAPLPRVCAPLFVVVPGVVELLLGFLILLADAM